MALLVDLLHAGADPAYADAAAVRAASPPGAVRPRRTLAPLVALVLVGVVAGTVAAAVHRSSSTTAAGRVALVDEVRRRTAGSDALVRQEQVLRADVAARRDAALGAGGADALAGLELAAGTVAVTGPGLVATLDDRPDGTAPAPAVARGGQLGSGRVLDRDLQQLVNGLWAAGAEAVSINDLRLSARTAIRSAGEAVLVDYRPLSPPYVVRAIGDPATLEPDFADGAAGRQLATYSSLYGLRFDVQPASGLQLPAASVAALRAATPVPAPLATP